MCSILNKLVMNFNKSNGSSIQKIKKIKEIRVIADICPFEKCVCDIKRIYKVIRKIRFGKSIPRIHEKLIRTNTT